MFSYSWRRVLTSQYYKVIRRIIRIILLFLVSLQFWFKNELNHLSLSLLTAYILITLLRYRLKRVKRKSHTAIKDGASAHSVLGGPAELPYVSTLSQILADAPFSSLLILPRIWCQVNTAIEFLFMFVSTSHRLWANIQSFQLFLWPCCQAFQTLFRWWLFSNPPLKQS